MYNVHVEQCIEWSVTARLLFECIANWLRLRNFSGNALSWVGSSDSHVQISPSDHSHTTPAPRPPQQETMGMADVRSLAALLWVLWPLTHLPVSPVLFQRLNVCHSHSVILTFPHSAALAIPYCHSHILSYWHSHILPFLVFSYLHSCIHSYLCYLILSYLLFSFHFHS